MNFDKTQFENFLGALSATKGQVDQILANAAPSEALSEATMLLLWQSVFDAMITTPTPEERLKWASTVEKIFSALTSRRALLLKETKLSSDTSKTPLDHESLADLQARLKLL